MDKNKWQFIEQYNNPRQILMSVGDNYLFTAGNFFLSVGETCGFPPANTVRPYEIDFAAGKTCFIAGTQKQVFLLF